MPFLNSPKYVGKYELGKTLGKGGFSKVKMAKHVENGTIVAIKIMDKEVVHKQDMVEKVKREILSMTLMNHPYVVQLLDVMASETKIYLVLEHVPGGELLNKIKMDKKRLREDEARKYFQQLIDGVDYFHGRNIYHRDLKPSNILIDASGDVKIVDFGISALCQQWRSDGLLHTWCGTPSYVAPEMISSKPRYDGAAADLWSCGVILFMLMAGYLPFQDSNIGGLWKKILQAKITFPAWISPDAKRLISRILDPNPTTRITIAQIRKDGWFSRGYMPPRSRKDVLNNIDGGLSEANDHEVRKTRDLRCTPINAFDMNSFFCGLEVSGFFKIHKEKFSLVKEMRFISKKVIKETKINIDSKLLSHWILV